jgi:hypothetical protein
MRRWQRLAALLEIFDVRGESFLDPFRGVFFGTAQSDDARKVGQVGTPTTVFCLFVDDDVLAR